MSIAIIESGDTGYSNTTLEDKGGGKGQLRQGSDISYVKKGGLFVRHDLSMSEDSAPPGFERFYIGGTWGVAVDPGGRAIALYPDKNNQDKKIRLEVPAGPPMQVEERTDYLRIYKDIPGANALFELIISDNQVKTWVTIYPGSPIDQIIIRYELFGLTENSNREIIDDDTGRIVWRRATPIMWDENDEYRIVHEDKVGNNIVYDFDTSGMVGDVIIDPQLVISPTTADNVIISFSATSNFGTLDEIRSGRAAGGIVRSPLRWDLSAIPSNIVSVDAVDLALYYWGFLQGNPSGIYRNWIFECLQAFGELTSTWNIYDTALPWGASGAQLDGTDYDSTTKSIQSTVTTGFDYYHWIDAAMKAQAFRAITVLGGVLTQLLTRDDFPTETGNSQIRWASREHTTIAWRPSITIDYSFAGEFTRSKQARPLATKQGFNRTGSQAARHFSTKGAFN
jgi:hypothetical protein